MKKWKRDKSLWLLAPIFLVVSLAAIILYFQLRPNHIAEDIAQKRQIKILLMVNDGQELVFSDFLVLDPITCQSALFDIPINTGSWDSVTSRYQYIKKLYRIGNSAKFISAIEKLSGEKIPYHIEIDYRRLSHLVDLIGGVEIFLADPVSSIFNGDFRMLPAGSFSIQGYQMLYYLQNNLPGETSIEFLKRKQTMFRSILQKSAKFSLTMASGTMKKNFLKSFSTNLDVASVLSFLKIMAESDSELMQFNQMRGDLKNVDGVEYFLPQKEGKLFKEQVRQIVQALGDESYIKQELLSVNLEILNGTKRTMLAARTTEYYQSYGYTVLVTGNAENQEYQKTIVLVRNNDYLRAAQRIAGIINCQEVVLRGEDPALIPDSWNGTDVTIILGSNYDYYRCR